MTSQNYSDEELKHTVHALLLEKQRVKELEQQIALFDKHELVEKSDRVTTLEDESMFLKSQISSLNQTLQSIQESKFEIVEELRDVKNNLEEAIEQNQRQQQTIEKLAAVVKEKERKCSEYQQFEYSFKKASERKHSLEHELEQERSAVEFLKREEELLKEKIKEGLNREKQLEKNQKSLDEVIERLQNETIKLKDESFQTNNLLTSYIEKAKDSEQQIEDLSAKLAQSETEKQEIVEELELLQNQFGSLKSKVLTTQQDLSQEQSNYQEALKQANQHSDEKIVLQKQLQEKNESLASYKKELDVIKQMVANGLKDTQELEARYLEAINEKVAAISKTHQVQQYVEKQREEIKILRDQLKEQISLYNQTKEDSQLQCKNIKEMNEKQIIQLEEQINVLIIEKDDHLQAISKAQSELENSLQYKQAFEEKVQQVLDFEEKQKQLEEQLISLEQHLKEKEQDNENCHQQINALFQDKQLIEESLSAFQSSNEENELRVRTAQQHLAKKVRETTLLNERLEEQLAQVNVLQTALDESVEKISELQETIDQSQLLEKQLQEKLNEQNKNTEIQLQKWEEKYFQVYDKWQITESTNRELKALEEKYQKMQSLFVNMGNLFSTPIIKPAEELVKKENSLVSHALLQTAPKITEEFRESLQPEALFSDQSLFDRQDTNARYKQSLFD